MEQENFTPQQSLAVINSMIEAAKNHLSENGHLYLLWGWVIFISSVGQFILLNIVHYPNHYFVWFLPWLAFIYQVFYLAKTAKRKKVRTYADQIIGFVWFTFFISLLIFGFILAYEFKSEYYRLICPVSLALYGIPTLLSGIILRFRPLIIGAVCCWFLSIGSLFAQYDYQLLFLSAAMIAAWIIPGYLLRKKFKMSSRNSLDEKP